MKFPSLRNAAFLLLVAFVPLEASADGLSFTRQTDGSRSGFNSSVSSGSVSLFVNQACNPQTFSQSAYLILWYTTQASPSGSGYVGATFSVGTIAGQTCASSISRTGTHTNPPTGTYYVHVLLSPTSSGSYDDAITGSSTVTFTAGGGGGSGGGGEVAFDGTLIVNVANGQTRMRGGVCNLRGSGTSGTLYWRLRLTQLSSPYSTGYTASEVSLNPLQSGFCYYNMDYTVPFTDPPPGTYYTHFTLTEYPAVNTELDSNSFGTTITISEPPSEPPAESGGALGLPGLAALLALLAARRRRSGL